MVPPPAHATPSGAEAAPSAGPVTPATYRPRLVGAALAAVLVVSTGATASALLRTSPTFDEPVFVSNGARGLRTGRWDLEAAHPPLTSYAYGLAVRLAGVVTVYPDESAGYASRTAYVYARFLFGGMGNDPERVALAARLVAAACVPLLAASVFALARARLGAWTALLAAALTAFLPDVLGHGGVAYNDLPLTLAFLLALHALDEAVRAPSPARGALAGAACSLALGIKASAVLLGPAAALLALAEAAAGSWREPAWRRGLLKAVAAGLPVAYLVLVVVWRGDVALDTARSLVLGRVEQALVEEHEAYLLGARSPHGWWYFYPVAVALKTPVALHVLGALGALALLRAVPGTSRPALLRSPLRAPACGLAVFGAALLAASLNIGTRHALPALPLACTLAAAGAARMAAASRAGRAAVVGLALAHAASSLSWHPHFLAFTNEYVPRRDDGYRFIADSSLDWGQGLLELRAFLAEEGIDRVYLAYFGSVLPEAYGIRYVPLPSFGALPPQPPPPAGVPPPRLVVVSATLLAGLYVEGDPYAPLRARAPYRVLGHTMFVFPADALAAPALRPAR